MAASTAFLMTLLGGTGTLVGSIVGATIVTILKNFISSYTERWTMVMGGLYIIVVVFSPGGMVGAFQTIKRKILEKKNHKVKQKPQDVVAEGGGDQTSI